MAGSNIQLYPVSVAPTPPPVGAFNFFIEGTTLYLQDSSGNLYPFGSTNAIDQLVGDVSAIGPGTATATVNSVGGQTASAIATATIAYGTATNSDTPNTLVLRDSSGNFSAGIISAALNGNASTATFATTAGSTVNFSGSLSGDVTGTQSATVVSLVDGYTAAAIGAAVASVQSATSLNTANALVQRDASGNFSANIINAALVGNVTGNVTGNVSGTAANVTGIVAITHGGTNSSAALVNNRVMISSAGAIIEASAITPSQALVSDVNGIPTASITTAIELSYVHGVTSSIQTQINSITSSGITSLTGDVTASGPGAATATVIAIQGNSVSSTAPTDSQFLIWNNGVSKYVPQSINGDATMTDTGDITLSSTAVTSKLLTGYVSGTNTPITATNSILTAFENLQAQISASLGSAITALTGDGTATGPGSAVFTLATVNSNVGNFGSSTAIPTITVNAKGLITAVTTNVVVAPAGTLTGTTLASNVVSSSLTSVGTITSGIWNGTAISIANGGTGQTTANAAFNALSPMTTLGDITYENATPTATRLPGNITATREFLTSQGTGTVANAPSWSALVSGDIPNNAANTSGTAANITATSNNTLITLSSLSLPTSQLTGNITAAQMLPLATNDIYVGNSSNQPAAVAMSGDVNIVASGATTIQPNVVGNSKLAQAPTDTLKGNNTGSTANVTDLTVSQVNTMLGTVTTIGTYDSQTSQANGLDIVGNSLYAQSANITNPGMVNTTTQSFAGNKTFTGTVAVTPSSTSAIVVNTTSFIFDSVNNALGIGLQPSTAVMIDGLNTSGASKLVQMTGYGVGSTTGYRGRFARGTVGSPAAVQAGDILSAVSGRGYGASQFSAASTGVINIVAGETFTNTSNLTYLQFNATPTGSVTSAEAMRVTSTGVTLGPQSASTAIHQINGGESNTTNTITASTYAVDSVTTDYIIYTDSTSNAITLTLPTPTNGRTLVIEDKTGQAATHSVTINPHASEKINGVSSLIISQPYGSVRLTSDGTNWFANTVSPSIFVPAVVALVESGGATTVNWAAGNMFTLTLNANLTISFSNAVAGQTIVIRLTNTASNYTVVWTGGSLAVKWPVQTAPVQTIGAFSDIYTILYDGVSYYGSYVQNF